MARLYELPSFLENKVSRDTYVRWLQRKAQAHVVRDRRRWKKALSVSDYKKAIHSAVIRSKGRDFYTGEVLDWNLLSRYDNTKSKSGAELRAFCRKVLAHS
jgi:hypothetical protein